MEKSLFQQVENYFQSSPKSSIDISKYSNISNFPDIIESKVQGFPDTFDFLGGKFMNPTKKYKIIRKLGQGKYGVVYLVLDIDKNKLNAIKFIPKKEAKKEIKCLQSVKGNCGHHILCYLGHFEYDDQMTAIVTEFDENYIGLKKYLKSKKQKLTLDEKKEIMKKIKMSINRLTAKGVMYGDLHIGNLMINVSDGRERHTIKIIDLGLCNFNKDLEKVKKANDSWIEKLNSSLNEYLENVSSYDVDELLTKTDLSEEDKVWVDIYYGVFGFPEWEDLESQ